MVCGYLRQDSQSFSFADNHTTPIKSILLFLAGDVWLSAGASVVFSFPDTGVVWIPCVFVAFGSVVRPLQIPQERLQCFLISSLEEHKWIWAMQVLEMSIHFLILQPVYPSPQLASGAIILPLPMSYLLHSEGQPEVVANWQSPFCFSAYPLQFSSSSHKYSHLEVSVERQWHRSVKDP